MRSAIAILCVVLAARVAAADASFVMVRNAKARDARASKDDVKSLYLGKRKTWNGGAAVVVIRGEDDDAFQAFADRIFGVSARTLLSKIKQEVFKGEMSKPFKAGNDDDVIKFVRSNASAIGMVHAEAARSLPADVAVLEVTP